MQIHLQKTYYLLIECNIGRNKFFWRCLLCLSISQCWIIICQLVQVLLGKLVVRKWHATRSYCWPLKYGITIVEANRMAFVKICHLIPFKIAWRNTVIYVTYRPNVHCICVFVCLNVCLSVIIIKQKVWLHWLQASYSISLSTVHHCLLFFNQKVKD